MMTTVNTSNSVSTPITNNSLLDAQKTFPILEETTPKRTSNKEPQFKLCYATTSFLPENETTQGLKSRCSNHGRIVSLRIETFQKYINQNLEQRNPSPKRETTRNST